MKVTIIGGGVMGEAILGAAIERGVFDPADVTVCELLEHRRAQLLTEYGVSVATAAGPSMENADLVVLSVKPQDLHSVQGAIPPSALLLSIMAGVRIATIDAEFRHTRIVRVMPNTPAAAKAGMSVWTATASVSDEQRELARGLLGAIGREMYVEDEQKLDMATAVSGSGPGYVFLMIEAMIEGAVTIGLSRKQAEEMVLSDGVRLGRLCAGEWPGPGAASRHGDFARRHDGRRVAGARAWSGARLDYRMHPRCTSARRRARRARLNHQVAQLFTWFLYLLILP